MIEIWIFINAIAGALAGVRGMQCHRRERDFWRAYDQRTVSKGIVAGPHMLGRGS